MKIDNLSTAMTRDEMRAALESVPAHRRLAVIFALDPDLRQRDIAAKADMGESAFSQTCAGRRPPTDDEKRSIAKAIGLPISILFGEQQRDEERQAVNL